MRVLILLVLLLTACGTGDYEYALIDEATCWYEDGNPTLHKYYPSGYTLDEEFERSCEQLGKPAQ
jgi:hypothetical protein